jgi:hypothetical protein
MKLISAPPPQRTPEVRHLFDLEQEWELMHRCDYDTYVLILWNNDITGTSEDR